MLNVQNAQALQDSCDFEYKMAAPAADHQDLSPRSVVRPLSKNPFMHVSFETQNHFNRKKLQKNAIFSKVVNIDGVRVLLKIAINSNELNNYITISTDQDGQSAQAKILSYRDFIDITQTDIFQKVIPNYFSKIVKDSPEMLVRFGLVNFVDAVDKAKIRLQVFPFSLLTDVTVSLFDSEFILTLTHQFGYQFTLYLSLIDSKHKVKEVFQIHIRLNKKEFLAYFENACAVDPGSEGLTSSCVVCKLPDREQFLEALIQTVSASIPSLTTLQNIQTVAHVLKIKNLSKSDFNLLVFKCYNAGTSTLKFFESHSDAQLTSHEIKDPQHMFLHESEKKINSDLMIQYLLLLKIKLTHSVAKNSIIADLKESEILKSF